MSRITSISVQTPTLHMRIDTFSVNLATGWLIETLDILRAEHGPGDFTATVRIDSVAYGVRQ